MTLAQPKKALLQKGNPTVRRGFLNKLLAFDENIEQVKEAPKAPSYGRVGCSGYDTCSAPICPLDPSGTAVWYPDEEICRNRETAKRFPFVRTQKRIQKRAVSRDTYYTLRMLEKITRVNEKTKGLSPESLSDDFWVSRRLEKRSYKKRDMP